MARTTPSKLCRRTYFLRSGTAPSISEMRNELGTELADVIIATLQPSQRTAVQPDRVLVSGESAPIAGEVEHDPETVRGQIHEHILHLGGQISERIGGYWRERLRTVATAVGSSSDDVDFLRFECRQKIAIARDEERQRYDRMLRNMADDMRARFWEEKGELHRSYAEARALWGRYVCGKVRKQAKDMLCKIAARYRVQLEQEVNRRMQLEKGRIVKEMEDIVKTAVDQQKRMDEHAIQWLIYQYEELLKFINEYNGCLQVVEMTRELCFLHAAPRHCRSTQVSNCSTSFEDRPLISDETAPTISCPDRDDNVRLPSVDLSKCDMFIVSQCLPRPERQHVSLSEEPGSSERSFERSPKPSTSAEHDGVLQADVDQSSIETVVIGGLTYAQPKYYGKTYGTLFGDGQLCWERMEPVEQPIVPDNVTAGSVATDRFSSTETQTQGSTESQPSFRVSYDPMAEISRTVLPSTESVPVGGVEPESPFGVLFDIAKSESEIEEVADDFAQHYIRATSDDFELMFANANDSK